MIKMNDTCFLALIETLENYMNDAINTENNEQAFAYDIAMSTVVEFYEQFKNNTNADLSTSTIDNEENK